MAHHDLEEVALGCGCWGRLWVGDLEEAIAALGAHTALARLAISDRDANGGAVVAVADAHSFEVFRVENIVLVPVATALLGLAERAHLLCPST